MPRRLYIPKKVLDAIQAHLADAIQKSVKGFWSANEDEDTMTGHLGACLKTGTHTVEVDDAQINGTWRWFIDYAKFRGRGKGATENRIGADGIIELSLSWAGRTETKAILFQSKLDWKTDDALVKQAVLLSTWREASIVINYREKGFEALSIDSVLQSRGSRANAKDVLPLQEALNAYFLQCKIGNTDLSYDPRSRRLRWRAQSGITVAAQFSIPHRIRIHVQSPKYKEKFDYEKLVPLSEIHAHRMQVEAEEVLMPLLTTRQALEKKQKQVLSMAYHPDRYGSLEQLFRDLVTRRMQEVNDAFAEVDQRGRS